MDGQLNDVGLGKANSAPMWLKLRVQHGFASQEERDRLVFLGENQEMEEGHPLYLACEPTGCESSGNTGGCSPGTACLFTCLQSKQK